ncbi:MAG TPA: hypothetical protein ENL03_05765, partial [Phycisphaerae bacterium]|nr:hypothetical protein [Phycisphaerae bacterium]
VIINGKIQRTVGPGIVVTFPFPIGEIERVSTQSRAMEIDDFWLHLDPEQMSVPLENLPSPQPGGLRPGVDGALLTGNQNLYHVKIIVNWKVIEARDFKSTLSDPEMTIRDAVCRAAVHTSASMSARMIESYRVDENDSAREKADGFAERIRKIASAELGKLNCGVEIASVIVRDRTMPRQTLPAFKATQSAASDKENKISNARSEATKTLNGVAGVAYAKLVGDPANRTIGAPSGLIGKYEKAMEEGDTENAKILLGKIDDVLDSGELTGQARGIIDEAQAYRTTVEQALLRRTDRFTKLLDSYNNPDSAVRDMLISDLLGASLIRIMSADNIEIIKIPSKGKYPYVYTLPKSRGENKKKTAKIDATKRPGRGSE